MSWRRTRRFWFSLLVVCALTPRLHADPVLDWNALMIDAIRVDNSGPTLSSRNLAILHCAMHDAVNSILRTHQPYRSLLEPVEPTSVEAAAASAGFAVMSALYPSFQGPSRALYDTWIAAAPKVSATTNGLALGREVAERMISERAADGSTTEVPYIPNSEAGAWQRTPPFFRPPVTPHWRYVTPFGLGDIEPFVPLPPPELGSEEYAAALNEVKALGGRTSAIRTPEQSEIAVFWSDFSYTSMPPGHWHIIAETIARTRGNTLAENARLFALLSIAQADAGIVCWEAKYRYNLWRPVTAIRRGSEDGNPETEADANWDHLLAAPPFPSYVSGHSMFSKASAQVLTHFTAPTRSLLARHRIRCRAWCGHSTACRLAPMRSA